MVDEPFLDIQLLVESKEQWKHRRFHRINIGFPATLPPDPAQTLVASFLLRRKDSSGCVVEKPAEGLLAKFIIGSGVEYEFVPQVVRRLRRHCYILPTASEIGAEKLLQAF